MARYLCHAFFPTRLPSRYDITSSYRQHLVPSVHAGLAVASIDRQDSPPQHQNLDFAQQRAAVSKSSPCLAIQLTIKLCTWRPLLCNNSKVERWRHHAWGFVPCTAWIRERIIGPDSEAKLTEHSPSLMTSGSCSTLPSTVQDAGMYTCT